MTTRMCELFDVLIRSGRRRQPWFHAYEKFGMVPEKHRTTAPK